MNKWIVVLHFAFTCVLTIRGECSAFSLHIENHRRCRSKAREWENSVSIDGSCDCGTQILLFVDCFVLFLSLCSRIVNRYTQVYCRTHTRASAAFMWINYMFLVANTMEQCENTFRYNCCCEHRTVIFFSYYSVRSLTHSLSLCRSWLCSWLTVRPSVVNSINTFVQQSTHTRIPNFVFRFNKRNFRIFNEK